MTEGGPRHRLGRLLRPLALGHGASQTHGRADLGEVAGHDAAPEDRFRPGEVSDAGGDLTAREHLDDSERCLTSRELCQHDAFQRLVIFTEDEVAEPLAYLTLHQIELAPDVVHVGTASGQLGLELRIVGAEAELHASVRHERFHSREQRIDVRFAEAVRVKPFQVDDRLQAALGEEARDDLLLEHALELARDSRGKEEAGLSDVERKSAGGADGVVDHLGRDGQHRLFLVVRRHHTAAPAKEVLHPDQPLLVEDEIDASGLGGDFLRQIVDGGAEAAVDDDRVGALGGELK